MAMLRKQFKSLSNDQLKTLIKQNVLFLEDVSRHLSLKPYFENIHQTLNNENDAENLRLFLKNLMAIVLYWDETQDNHGFFPKVVNQVVSEKLQAVVPNFSSAPTFNK